MAEVELSFWAKVVLGGLLWTFASTLFALFLGRLLRDPSHDTERSLAEDPVRDLEDAAAPPQPFAGPVLARAVTAASGVDELPPAEPACDESEDESTRSSGTRYRPVASTEAGAPRRLRSVG